jgi:hypothetical protein
MKKKKKKKKKKHNYIALKDITMKSKGKIKGICKYF